MQQKSKRTRKGNAKTADTVDRMTVLSKRLVPVGHDKIARMAYEIWENRGGVHGRDFDDWLIAETALTTASQ